MTWTHTSDFFDDVIDDVVFRKSPRGSETGVTSLNVGRLVLWSGILEKSYFDVRCFCFENWKWVFLGMFGWKINIFFVNLIDEETPCCCPPPISPFFKEIIFVLFDFIKKKKEKLYK